MSGTDRFGIDDHFQDARGVDHAVSAETLAALRASMGVAADTPAPPPESESAVRVLFPGANHEFKGAADITLEDGRKLTVEDGAGELPEDLPHGYHRL